MPQICLIQWVDDPYGPIKLFRGHYPEKALKRLQEGSPYELHYRRFVNGTWEAALDWKKRFEFLRLEPSGWYLFTPDMLTHDLGEEEYGMTAREREERADPEADRERWKGYADQGPELIRKEDFTPEQLRQLRHKPPRP